MPSPIPADVDAQAPELVHGTTYAVSRIDRRGGLLVARALASV